MGLYVRNLLKIKTAYLFSTLTWLGGGGASAPLAPLVAPLLLGNSG